MLTLVWERPAPLRPCPYRFLWLRASNARWLRGNISRQITLGRCRMAIFSTVASDINALFTPPTKCIFQCSLFVCPEPPQFPLSSLSPLLSSQTVLRPGHFGLGHAAWGVEAATVNTLYRQPDTCFPFILVFELHRTNKIKAEHFMRLLLSFTTKSYYWKLLKT